jgi:MFS family permease
MYSPSWLRAMLLGSVSEYCATHAGCPGAAAGTGGPGTGRAREAFSWRFVTPLLSSCTLNPINSTLIATALVPIAHAMYVSVGRTTVLVSALYLACAVGQPTAGKLAEQLGPRRVFLTGFALVLLRRHSSTSGCSPPIGR